LRRDRAGLCGDRAYGLVDQEREAREREASEKWGRLFDFRADFVEPPRVGAPRHRWRITFPRGASVTSEEPGVSRLSRGPRRPVVLMTMARRTAPSRRFGRGQGRTALRHHAVRAGGRRPRDGRAAAFRAPAGTFFDFCAIHLVTTNTLDRCASWRRRTASRRGASGRTRRRGTGPAASSRTTGPAASLPSATCASRSHSDGSLRDDHARQGRSARDPACCGAMASTTGFAPAASASFVRGVYAFVVTGGTNPARRSDPRRVGPSARPVDVEPAVASGAAGLATTGLVGRWAGPAAPSAAREAR